MRRARDAAHRPSLGVHVGRHRQERTSQRPQRTQRWHVELTVHIATLRVRRVAIECAARVVPTLPATLALPLTRLRGGRLRGLRMVGVGPTLVLRVVMERLATS